MEVAPASSTAGGWRPTTLICPATHDPSRRAAPPSSSLHHPGPYPDSWTPRRIHRRLRRPTVRPPARQQQRCPPNRPPSISFCFQQGYVLSVAGVYPAERWGSARSALFAKVGLWQGERVPKAEVARRLGIGRTTLYRYLPPTAGRKVRGALSTHQTASCGGSTRQRDGA